MASRFKKNPAYQRQLANDPKTEAAKKALARALVAFVKDAAPEGGTGHYARSIKAVDNAVVTTDIAGHIIEFGSIKNPPYAPLRRGIRAAGLRLNDTPK